MPGDHIIISYSIYPIDSYVLVFRMEYYHTQLSTIFDNMYLVHTACTKFEVEYVLLFTYTVNVHESFHTCMV